MNMAVFWVVEPCILVEIDLHFRSAYCLYHQGDEDTVSFLDSSRSWQRPATGYYHHGKEPSVLMQSGAFLDYLTDYYLLTQNAAARR
jgi:hypothetical protein